MTTQGVLDNILATNFCTTPWVLSRWYKIRCGAYIVRNPGGNVILVTGLLRTLKDRSFLPKAQLCLYTPYATVRSEMNSAYTSQYKVISLCVKSSLTRIDSLSNDC